MAVPGRITMKVPSSALEHPSAHIAAAKGSDPVGEASAFAYYDNHLHVSARIYLGGEQTWTDIQVPSLGGEVAYEVVIEWDETAARLSVNGQEQEARPLTSRSAQPT